MLFHMNTLEMMQEMRSVGDDLHNNNCYSYLIKIAEGVNLSRIKYNATYPAILDIFNNLYNVIGDKNNIKPYNPRINYGDYYRKFLKALEKHAEELKAIILAEDEEDELAQLVKQIIRLIYINRNASLENAYERIQLVLEQGVNQTTTSVEEKIRAELKKNVAVNAKENKYTPQGMGGQLRLVKDALAGNYKPMFKTNIPAVKTYMYHQFDTSLAHEIRCVTQGQYHKGQPRVNPLFELWLDIAEQSKPHKITHVYFNNLKRREKIENVNVGLKLIRNITDKFTGEYERQRESNLSRVLDELETTHKNIAVITLPADGGKFFNKNELTQYKKIYSYQSIFDDLKNMLEEKQYIPDFHISAAIREQLKLDDAKINYLIKKSFESLGFKDQVANLNSPEIEAIAFHLFKFELPNYILETLKPDSFNMSCKDAIDRGGVSSAYYNLIKSISAGSPMTKAEFEKALHAAPALVKGRGVNSHSKFIWNAINSYVEANKQTIEQDTSLHWLLEWRNNHPLKNSKVALIEELERYIKKRETERSNNTAKTLYKRKDVKIAAARNLQRFLNQDLTDLKFSVDEQYALMEGRLGAIYKKFANLGLEIPDNLKEKSNKNLLQLYDDKFYGESK